MGVVRWTAKGLKIIGQLLEAKEIEDWLEEKGKEFIETKLKEIPVKWIAGKTRAKNKIISEIHESVKNSETFQTSLEISLGKLPNALLDVAYHLRNNKFKSLCINISYKKDLIICPRGLVLEHFAKNVVDELKDSAELSRYVGLPERFLYNIAMQTENSFFIHLTKGNQELLSGNNIAIGVDDNYGWNYSGIKGHYYAGSCEAYGTDFSDRKQKKEFVNEAELLLKKIKSKLGKLSKKEIEDIVKQLPLP